MKTAEVHRASFQDLGPGEGMHPVRVLTGGPVISIHTAKAGPIRVRLYPRMPLLIRELRS